MKQVGTTYVCNTGGGRDTATYPYLEPQPYKNIHTIRICKEPQAPSTMAGRRLHGLGRVMVIHGELQRSLGGGLGLVGWDVPPLH